MGDDFVRGWIRDKVVEGVKSGMQKPKAKREIDAGFHTSATEIFSRIARSFRESVQEVVDEYRFQQRKFEEEIAAKMIQLGTPEAIEAEVEKLEARASQVRNALDELERVVQELRQELA